MFDTDEWKIWGEPNDRQPPKKPTWGEGVMDDLPICPKCRMRIEVARYWDGGVDAYWNPVFTIYCGCPDCRNFVALNCIVSEAFVGNGTASPTKRQEFWDSQYEIAVEQWKEKNKAVN